MYTIDDWHDGAREGAADYQRRPHAYRSLCLDSPSWNPDDDRFELRQLTPDALAWFLERNVLFQRWNAAYNAGHRKHADADGITALPSDRARAEQLERWIADTLHRAEPFVVHGSFEYGPEHGPVRARVRWTPASEPQA